MSEFDRASKPDDVSPVYGRQLRQILNYVGQLRLYSYADLLLLFAWLQATPRLAIACSLLWFGFLVYLETIHKDCGRSRWHWSVWMILWIVGASLSWNPSILLFFAASILYTFKKKPKLGWASPLFNGAVKTSLVWILPLSTPRHLLMVFAVMAFRNLMGDFRDARKDYAEGLRTLPVVFGYHRDTRYVYPFTLAITSALWTILGSLRFEWLICAWLLQLMTYSWTPR